MPPKNKKSLTLWQKCEECSCIFSIKDISNHHIYCSLPRSEWSVGYIADHTLFGVLEDLKNKDLSKSHISNYDKNIILLSQSAMQLCGFSIGFPVLVETLGYTTILKAWPTLEGSLTTVSLNKKEQELLSGIELNSQIIKISKLEENHLFAKKVNFQLLDSKLVIPNSLQFCKSLQSALKDRIIFLGMLIMLPFYGKQIRMKISAVETHTAEFITNVKSKAIDNDLSADLGKLSLTVPYFLTFEKTEWVNEIFDSKHKESSGVKQYKIGGYNSTLSELRNHISSTFSKCEKEPSSFSVLLYGPCGCGKTSIAQYLAQESDKTVVNIQSSELFSKFYGETENRLRQCFEKAKTNAPCVVIIDNIEILGSRKAKDQERRVLSCLLSMFDSIISSPIVVIATTIDPDLLDPSLRRPGRLESEIEINIPSKEDRFEILKVFLPEPNLDSVIGELAFSCHGFVGADLKSLVDKAILKSISNNTHCVSESDLHWAFSQVKPSAMRQLQIHVPSVKWSDIGGGKDIRLRLEQAVEWPLRYAENLKRLGITAPKGVLLYGPPGCSKTLLVKALATETNLNFISIKGSDVFSKWVGESEKAIRDLFRSARKVAPAIVFLDEVDALGASRGTSVGSNVHDRVLSQLLMEMDGVNPLDGVVVVAATNRPDCIDKALMRPGRLDRIIYVPLPDYETREQIFEIQLKNMPTNDVNIKELAEITEGYSGAEVVAVCREAALSALQEDMNASFIKMSHFNDALSKITPRTPQILLQLYDEYRKKRETT